MKTLPNTITRWEKLMKNLNDIPLGIVLEYDVFIKFIKQLLKPCMFIPWDDENNCPFEEPDKDNMAFYTHKNISIQEEYQQAKDRVLFDGFEYEYVKSSKYKTFHVFKFNKWTIYYDVEAKEFEYTDMVQDYTIKTIQDLCDKVQLTPNGIKQAGL